MKSIAQNSENEQHFSERIKKFFREYEIGKALHTCNGHKQKGFSVVEIMTYLFSLVFLNRSMFSEWSFASIVNDHFVYTLTTAPLGRWLFLWG